MAQQIRATISSQFATAAQQFVNSGNGSDQEAGVSSSGGFSFSLVGSTSGFSRLLLPLNADFNTGSGIGNEGFKFQNFPEMENSAGDPILDVNGLPLQFATLTLVQFVVRAIDPSLPWGGTVKIATTNLVPGNGIGKEGIASDCVLQYYEAAGWEPDSNAEIIIEFLPTTAPTSALMNAFVEMNFIGNPDIPVVPVFSVQPSQTGGSSPPEASEVLTAVSGTYTGVPTPLSGYQWLRYDVGGTYLLDIPGANGLTYTIQAGDVGYRVGLRQTVSNSAGTAYGLSTPVATVVP